jgi:hypothetical protein
LHFKIVVIYEKRSNEFYFKQIQIPFEDVIGVGLPLTDDAVSSSTPATGGGGWSKATSPGAGGTVPASRCC